MLTTLFARCSLGTGMEYNPTTALEIIDVINNLAGDGDIVIIPSGVFDCSATLLSPSSGVTVYGAGDPFTEVRGRWLVDLTGGGCFDIHSLKVDIAGLGAAGSYASVEQKNGYLTMRDATIAGTALDPGTENGFQLNAFSETAQAAFTRVIIKYVEKDLYSARGTGASAPDIAESYLLLTDCVGFNCGPNATNNYLTNHDGVDLIVNGGNYDGDNGYAAVQPDSGISSIYLTNVVLGNACVRCFSATNCRITGGAYSKTVLDIKGDGGVALNNVVTSTSVLTTAGIAFSDDNPTCEGNFVSGVTKPGAPGMIFYDSVLGDVSCQNNRGLNCGRAFNIDCDLATLVTFRNNISYGSTSQSVLVAAGVTIDNDYNTLWKAKSNYTPGANDDVGNGTIPELQDNGMPVVGGNVDRNGDPTVTLVSDVDYLGHPRFTGDPTVISRGPLETYLAKAFRRIQARPSARV